MLAEDEAVDPVDKSVDWSCSREANISLDRVGEAAELVVAATPAELVLDVDDDACPDGSAETASTSWLAAEAVACRAALMRLCC